MLGAARTPANRRSRSIWPPGMSASVTYSRAWLCTVLSRCSAVAGDPVAAVGTTDPVRELWRGRWGPAEWKLAGGFDGG